MMCDGCYIFYKNSNMDIPPEKTITNSKNKLYLEYGAHSDNPNELHHDL